MSFLGISAHKTTTYGVQQFSPVNEGWIADPVATASATAVAKGSNIPDSVQNMYESGIGYQMRQYYQLATRRWKKRLINWEMKLMSSKGFALTNKALRQQFPSLNKKQIKVVQTDYHYNINGAKYFSDMSKLGINDLDSESISLTAISPASVLGENLSRSWIIGSDVTNNNRPAILLHPQDTAPDNVTVAKVVEYIPEPSIGIVYWETSDKPKESTYLSERDLSIRYSSEFDSLNIGTEWVAISEISDWEDDGFYIDTVSIHVVTEPDKERQQEEQQLRANVEYKTVIEVRRSDSKLYYRFRIDKYEYEKEGYIWATKTSESESGVRNYFTDLYKTTETVNKVWKSSDPLTKSTFKPYPCLPTKEVGKEIMDWSSADKYLKAVDVMNDLGKKEEPREADIHKNIRKEQRLQALSDRINKKNSKSSSDNSDQEKKPYTRAKRTLIGTKKYTRKTKSKGNLIDKSDKRYLELLASKLGQDYSFIAASVHQMPESHNVMNAGLCITVPFGSNFDEADHYWYKYFDRMYDVIGNGGYTQFSYAVNNTLHTHKDTFNLPYYRMDFNTPAGQYGGMMGFAYIRKFRIKGRIRQTQRGRVRYEIKRGVLTNIINSDIDTVKRVFLNPSLDLVDDKYHTSKNGKEYNIGGGKDVRNASAYTVASPTYTKTIENITENLLDPTLTDKVKQLTSNIYKAYERFMQGNALANPDPALSVIKSGRRGAFFSHNRGGYKGVEGIALDWDDNVNRLIFERFGYTFMCKKINENELDVIAVAGLVFGTHNSYDNHITDDRIHGVNIVGRANTQLDLHFKRNKAHYVDGASWNNINVFIEYGSGSSKYRYNQQIRQFCILPMDYKVYSRLGAASQAKLAPRVVQQQIWQKQRVRTLRKWIKPVIQIIGFIISVIVAIVSWNPAAGVATQTAIQAAIQVIKQIVIALIVAFAIGQVMKLLIKVLGLKGFIALVIAIVVAMLTAAYTGYFNASALPLATETAVQTVAQSAPVIASEAARQSIMQAIMASIRSSIQGILQQTFKEALVTSLSLLNAAANTISSDMASQMQAFQNDFIENQRKYNEVMKNLNELQESNERYNQPYDVKVVMNALRSKLQIEPLDTWIDSKLAADSLRASEGFLAAFLDSKLNLDPLLFEAVRSLDFSLQSYKMV